MAVAKISSYFRLGVAILFGLLFLYHQVRSFDYHGLQYFRDLAAAMLQGKLHLLDDSLFFDLVDFQGHKYLPFGIFPSFLILPVYLFFPGVTQAMVMFCLNFLNVFLIYKIARTVFKIERTDSFILSTGLLLGTNYIFLLLYGDLAHYFSQAVAFSMVLLAVYFYFVHKKIALTALFCALAFLTRSNLIFLSLFFLGDMFFHGGKEKKWRQLAVFAGILAVGVGAYCLYNYARFGDPLESGYKMQIMTNGVIQNNQMYGIFSPQYIPTNIYYFLLKGPELTVLPGTKIATFPYVWPNPWGMSILFSAPILLLGLFRPHRKDWLKRYWLLIAVTLLNLLIIFSYYGIGVRQYGYRYAIDFYPLLFLLVFMQIRKKIPIPWIVLLVLSVLFNMHMNFLAISTPL